MGDQVGLATVLIGSVVLRRYPRGLAASARNLPTGNIGYDLARELWGQGLATEALTAAIRFGFSEIQFNRIEAETIADNEPSTRLLGRLGFAREETRQATGTTTAPSTTERSTVSSATADQRLTPSLQLVSESVGRAKTVSTHGDGQVANSRQTTNGRGGSGAYGLPFTSASGHQRPENCRRIGGSRTGG